jgi:hypothetical protein
LHPENGFTGSQRPDLVLSAEQGEMIIRFRTDSLLNAKGFSAVFSADCPPLVPGEGNGFGFDGKIISNVFRAEIFLRDFNARLIEILLFYFVNINAC